AKAKDTLTKTLRDHWLNLLPPPLDQTCIEIEEMSTLKAANTVAFEVPMPVYNHWKLKSKFAFRSLTAAEFQPIINFLLTEAPTDDPTRGAGFLNLLLMGGQSNQIDPNSAVVPAREGPVLWYHAGALWTEQSCPCGKRARAPQRLGHSVGERAAAGMRFRAARRLRASAGPASQCGGSGPVVRFGSAAW
ncbi:MAG: hypothetical protein ACHQ0J_15220, partial [Candidatus Dormibacterales bacterium]